MTNTVKTLIVLAIATRAVAFAATPLQQALEIEQDVKKVIEALGDINQPIESLKQAPAKIRSITRIGDFLDGDYAGPIVFNGTSFSVAAFKNLMGSFDVYAPNWTSTTSEIFTDAIGLKAFYGTNIVSTGANTFYNAYNLHYVWLPNCTALGNYTFYGCTSLTNAYIPSVATIGTYAFQGCYNFKDFSSLPLTLVNDNAFYGCTSLTNVQLSLDTVTFNKRCFYNCQKLDIKQWPSNISFSYGSQFYNCKSLTDINPCLQRLTMVTGTDNSEQGRQFQNCTGLTYLHSDNLTVLGSYGIFDGCTSVTNIDFPNVIQLGYGTDGTTAGYLFNNQVKLKTVNLPKLERINSTGTGYAAWNIFGNCTSLEEIELPSLKTIGNIESTANWAYGDMQNMFANCHNLRSARFPSLHTLLTFGNGNEQGMFYNCYNLVDVQMPSLRILKKKIEYNNPTFNPFFAHCTKLAEVNFPSLEQIQRFCTRMFYDCPSLRKVKMPKLTHINNNSSNDTGTPNMGNMFYLCPALTDVTFGFTASTLKNYAGFPGGAPTTCVFHGADTPEVVDIMYRNGAWEVVTNGTYKLVEWISSDGNQYINTGYTHKTNTVVEIDFSLSPQESPRQYEYIFGARNNSDTVNSYALLSIWNYARKLDYMRNSNVQSEVYSLDAEMRLKAVCNLQTCEIYDIGGNLLYSLVASGTPNQGVGPLAIFTCNNASSGAFSPISNQSAKNMKLYRFTVKEDDTTVMDLVPGLRGEDAPCLLDAANNWHPLFNNGTSDFTYGSVTNSLAIPGE